MWTGTGRRSSSDGTKAMLGLDTAASGLYISRSLAEANGLTARAGDPPGTVHAEAVQLGPLVFKDCVVGRE